MRTILLRGGAIALAALFCLTNIATADIVQTGGDPLPNGPPLVIFSFCSASVDVVQGVIPGADCKDALLLPGGVAVPATPDVCAIIRDPVDADVGVEGVAASGGLVPDRAAIVATSGKVCVGVRWNTLGYLYQHINYNQNTPGWVIAVSSNYRCSDFPQGIHFAGNPDLGWTEFDNQISSAKANFASDECSVKLFTDPQYRGSSTSCAPFCPNLLNVPVIYPRNQSMNDRTTSFWFEREHYS